MIINADNLILGRLASFAAKQALLGNNIEIINSREAVIVGDKRVVFARYSQKVKRGDPHHGPYFPTTPERILRKTIKNMLPYTQYKGKNAFKKIKCYLTAPSHIKEGDAVTLEKAKLKSTTIKYIKLKDLVYLLKQK